jgi:hypothetical protein
MYVCMRTACMHVCLYVYIHISLHGSFLLVEILFWSFQVKKVGMK